MAIVYFVLRHLTNLTGWDSVADVILHYMLPILFVIDWLFLVPKESLKAKDTYGWPAYPIARVLLNEAGMLIVFLILGFVLVTGGRLLDKQLGS